MGCCRGIQGRSFSVQTNSCRISPLVTVMIWRQPTAQKSCSPAAARGVLHIAALYVPYFLHPLHSYCPCGTPYRARGVSRTFRQEQHGSSEQSTFVLSLVVSVTSMETANTVQFSSGTYTELGTEVLLSRLQPPDITAGQTW